MSKPFANAPQFNGTVLDSYIIGIQTGRLIDSAGLDQMKFITIGQLKNAVERTLSALFTFRGIYSSTVPDSLATNDYFYCNADFTDASQDIDDGEGNYTHTFYQYHLYGYNGTVWADITPLLIQGMPVGGTTGQVLKKASNADYDVEWSSDSDQDTKNTAGATDSNQKLYIVGAPEQTANPQTYTQDTAYVGADGALYSENKKVLTDHQNISGKADKVVGATTGDVAQLDSSGNLVDSGVPISTVLTESDVKDNTTSQDTNKPLSANQGYKLQGEIDQLKAMGRFLSLWDCITGLPVSFPLSIPYSYKSGDYYVISNSVSYIKDNTNEYDDTADYAVNEYTVYQDVLYRCNTAIVGGEAWNSAHWDAVTNDYIPTGSSYTGTASSVVATEEIFVNDSYVYDGTYWLHQINTGGKVAFQNIKGNPKDNLALAAELNDVVKHDSDLPASTTPINANQLNGHQDTYFGKAGNLAVVETSPSTEAHSVGELIVFNGTLYQVTLAIAIGDTLTVGSNIAGQTVANALSDIIGTIVTNANGYGFTLPNGLIVNVMTNIGKGGSVTQAGSLYYHEDTSSYTFPIPYSNSKPSVFALCNEDMWGIVTGISRTKTAITRINFSRPNNDIIYADLGNARFLAIGS